MHIYKAKLLKRTERIASDGLFDVPLIIDNGSYECRAGYASFDLPNLVFPNVVYKPRMSKSVLVGNEIVDFESVRHFLKSPYLENLVTNLDIQEYVFNFIFESLNFSGDNSNPLVINESLCNPAVCRSQMSELLFETFSVSKVAYYVDALASYFENFRDQLQDGCLVISLGYQKTHLIPMSFYNCDNTRSEILRPMVHCARRLHTGGLHISWFLQRLLQLKYPYNAERLSVGLAEELIENYGQVVENYRSEMNNWKDYAFRMSNQVKVQLPYVQPSDEDLKALADRKRAQTERLLTAHRKRQEQQLSSLQERVEKLQMIKNSSIYEELDVSKNNLAQYGSSDLSRLNKEVINCKMKITKLQNQLSKSISTGNGEDEVENETNESLISFSYASFLEQNLASNSFGVCANEYSGREKRAAECLFSLTLPSAVQAQVTSNSAIFDHKFNEAKLANRIKLAQELEFGAKGDFALWLNMLRDRRSCIAKKRTQRQNRVDLATQMGLHSTDLVSMNKKLDSMTSEKNFNSKTSNQIAASNLGTNGIKLHTGGDLIHEDIGKYSESKRVFTERRRMQLEKIRAMAAELKPSRGRSRDTVRTDRLHGLFKTRGRRRRSEIDNRPDFPDFIDDIDMLTEDFDDGEYQLSSFNNLLELDLDADDDNGNDELGITTVAGKQTTKIGDYKSNSGDESENERDQLAVLDSLLTLYDPESSKDLGTSDLRVDLSEFYQLRVDTELWRSPEVLFQPSFIGNNEAGLSECFEFVLRDTRKALEATADDCKYWPKRIFLTGGPACLTGLEERIRVELRSLLPYGPEYNNIEIVLANNPHLDAWNGARRWALLNQKDSFISSKQYEECGPHYLRENAISNYSWLITG